MSVLLSLTSLIGLLLLPTLIGILVKVRIYKWLFMHIYFNFIPIKFKEQIWCTRLRIPWVWRISSRLAFYSLLCDRKLPSALPWPLPNHGGNFLYLHLYAPLKSATLARSLQIVWTGLWCHIASSLLSPLMLLCDFGKFLTTPWQTFHLHYFHCLLIH